MYTIGDFARLGGVSVRMLRHYDATGLLTPARVDPATGYRFYAGSQVARLDRLLALKDLGFTLEQVRGILDDAVSPEELRGMLRLRRAELADRIEADTARLARVERRLRSLEEDPMSQLSPDAIAVSPVAGHRLASLTTSVESIDEIGSVVGPLFGRLGGMLAAAGVHPAEPSVAVYDLDPDGRVHVRVGFPTTAGPVDGVEVVDLPALERVAHAEYHGGMGGIGDAWQELMRWCDAQGYVPDGQAREVYLSTPEDAPDAWVTELQQPVRPV